MTNRVGQQLGTYRLISLIGQGGFADVYLGQQQFLTELYAIKVWHTSLSQRDKQDVLSEARMIASFKHPHIIHVHYFDVETGSNTPFLVMDYAPGGTLRQRHPQGMILAPDTVSDYVQQIADALFYVHQQHRIVHRDIKPENMLVNQYGGILLSDFGIATIMPSLSAQNRQIPGSVVGTVDYMAPELFHKQPCPASDQYALAAVAYEWLSGGPPFEGDSLQEVMNAHLFESPPSLLQRVPTLSPAVESVVFKALSKEPTQRFPTIKAFTDALSHACGQDSTSIHPPIITSASSHNQPSQSTQTAQPSGSGRRAFLITMGGLIALPIIWGVSASLTNHNSTTSARSSLTPTSSPPATQQPIASNGLLTPGVLLWGGDSGVGGAPYVFLDANGNPVGFEVDIANALAKHMSITPVFQQTPYKKLEDTLRNRHIDMILNGWEVTLGRQQDEAFSTPYYRYSQQLVVRADDQRFSNYTVLSQITLAELTQYKFGTGSDYKAADLLRSVGFKPHTSEVPLDDLKRKLVDIVMLDTPIAAYYVLGQGFSAKPDNTLRPIGHPLFSDAISNYVIGFKKNDKNAATLRQEVDQALLTLKQDGTLKSIYQTWGLWNDLQQDIGIT